VAVIWRSFEVVLDDALRLHASIHAEEMESSKNRKRKHGKPTVTENKTRASFH
jgi:hypothetical protein